ncbi:MAG: hypothetical protein IJR50_01400 [Treponema sp.]|nr:hypothetical protein [Treponema sp.]
MILFGKKVEVYESRDEKQFKAVKKKLKTNRITYGTSWTQNEVTGGCGCKINVKQVANPHYSPFVWYVFVRPEDEQRARSIVSEVMNS